MFTSIIRACLLLVGLVFSLTVHAAGLGKLTINSSLGQPLNAEIDLVSVSDEEFSTLKAVFASREAFSQAGIRYENYYDTFSISIESRINGDPYVKIISPQAVNEPFLNMLVEISWASGRLLREYTVLLDPVDARRPEPIAPIVPAIEEKTASANAAEVEAAPLAQDSTQPTTIASAEERTVETLRPASQASVQTPGTYGPILEGDTLSSIARQVKPEAVNINQMLVALFRANREAFIADNMNLLRTGVILKIPNLQELAEISEREANIEVRVQVNDWHKYRQNLASSTQEPHDLDALNQQASGQITTAVDNAAVSRSEPPEEVLRLSSGERLLDSQDPYSEISTQERLRMMEEDAIARNLALKEANERVAMLEKNIENLQKLLALQSPELAQAQINAETQAAVEAEQPQAEIESIEVISSESVPATGTEFDFIQESETIAVQTPNDEDNIASEPVVPATQVAAVASMSNPVLLPESEEASILDQMMDNMTYIGAAFAILLLSMFAVIYRRKRKAAEEEALAEESRYEELSSALRNKTAAAVAAAHATDGKDEDIDEFDQTNQFFPDENPEEKVDAAKLDSAFSAEEQAHDGEEEPFDSEQPIELDFSKENEKAENELDNPLDELEMDAFDENQPESGSLDDSIEGDDGNSLDFEADFDVNEQSASVQVSDEKLDIDQEQILDFPHEEEPTSSDSESDYELKIDFDEPGEAEESDALKLDLADQEPESELVQRESDLNNENTLDFSLDSSTFELSDESGKREEQTPVQESSSDDEMNTLDMAETGGATDDAMNSSAGSGEQISDIDFSDIDLDIEKENLPDVSENPVTEEHVDTIESAAPETETKSEQWHEIETKIDLAKAYLEMEDLEGAREMLEEVVQEGDENQQKAARELLEKL
ncbi:MAG: hypothetical protein MRK00_15485 [Nitrosomonas sp.]|nr:hypothetical protein [Nitrosomonas sp.]